MPVQALLIDEVDVFFSDEFYGNEYRPLALLRHPAVSAFIIHAWDNRDGMVCHTHQHHVPAHYSNISLGGFEDAQFRRVQGLPPMLPGLGEACGRGAYRAVCSLRGMLLHSMRLLTSGRR